MTPNDIKLLESIFQAQNDMELSETSDQLMRDLRQLIKRETTKTVQHRFRPALGEGTLNLPLDYCLLCGLNEAAKKEGRLIHVAWTRVLFNGQGDFVKVVPSGGCKIPAGCFIDSVSDNALGHLINGDAQLQNGLLFYPKEDMLSTRPFQEVTEE